MIINVKKAQVDTVKLQKETEVNKMAIEEGIETERNALALAYLPLEYATIKRPDSEIIREQAESFTSEVKSTSGFFSKIGSKADNTMAKLGRGIADKLAGIEAEEVHALVIVATIGDSTLIEKTGNLSKLRETLGILGQVSESCRVSMETAIELAQEEGLELWVYITDPTDYKILSECYSKPDTAASKFAIEAVENLLSDTASMLHNLENYAEAEGFRLFKYTYSDVLALNLIKLVKKSTDTIDNDFIGESSMITVEALTLSEDNTTEIIKTVDFIGRESTLRIGSSKLKSMKAISLKEVEVEEIQGEAFDKVNTDCVKLDSFEKEQVKEAEDVMYEASEIMDDNLIEKDFLALLLVPVNHDLSNSFKAKYI